MKTVVVAGISLLLIWVAGGFAITIVLDDWPTRGQFGDMFGAVNALFSSLALIGVIVAILFQKQELALQRTELELTRKEMEKGVKAQADAAKALANQLDNQILASRLNALSTLVTATDNQINRIRSIARVQRAEGSIERDTLEEIRPLQDFKDETLKEICQILNNKL